MRFNSLSQIINQSESMAPLNYDKSSIFDFSNWEVIKNTRELIDEMHQFGENTKVFFDTFAKVVYYLTNPKLLAWMIWNGLVKYSFWICIFICLFGIIAYLAGWTKGKQWAKGSMMFYIIVQMFNIGLS